MFGFDKMFDFNYDGRLDSFERAAELQFIDEIVGEENEEPDVFGDAGLDYDELEMMNPEERREVLEDAGLDPDDFDF